LRCPGAHETFNNFPEPREVGREISENSDSKSTPRGSERGTREGLIATRKDERETQKVLGRRPPNDLGERNKETLKSEKVSEGGGAVKPFHQSRRHF